MVIRYSNLSVFGYEEIVDKDDPRASVNARYLEDLKSSFTNKIFTKLKIHLLFCPSPDGKYGVVKMMDEQGEKTFRLFLVENHYKETLVSELYRNKGLLNSEFKRIAVATNNFTYELLEDKQADALYSMEDLNFIPGDILGSLVSRNDVYDESFVDTYNKKKNQNPDCFGYALTVRQAKDLVSEVCEDYGLPLIETQWHSLEDLRKQRHPGDVALATCAFKSSSRVLLQQKHATNITLNNKFVIHKHVLLHELAHTVASFELGTFSHDPGFVLTYMELLARYLNKELKHLLNMCKTHKVEFANPIFSSLFHTLDKEDRKYYKDMYDGIPSFIPQD